MTVRYSWLMWLNVILGLWLIVAPFVLNFSANTSAMVSSVVAGALVAIISVIALVVEPGRTSATARA